MFTVREDRTQFDVMIPPQHRAAFGDEIATRYEFRGLCVTPRAVQNRKAVVHAPRELEITAEPARTLLPLPTGVYRPCQADINTALIFSVASLLSSCSSPTPPDAIPGLNGLVLDAESNTRIAGATVQAAGK